MSVEAQDFQAAVMTNEAQANFDNVSRSNRMRLIVGAGLVVSGLAMAACGGGEGAGSGGGDGAQAGASTPKIETGPCADIAQFSENLADHDYAPNTNAYLPALYNTDSNGKNTLVSASKASELLQKQVCGDRRVLAVFAAIQQLWQKEQLPSADLITNIEGLYRSFQLSSTAAEKAEELVIPWLDNLVPTTNFAVTAGQATAITAERTDGILTSFKASPVNSTENLSVFQIGFVADNEGLTDTQRSVFAKLQTLVGVDAQGYAVINNLIANTTIGLTNPTETTGSTNPNSSSNSSSAKGQSGNTGNTANNAGVGVKNKGTTQENLTGPIPVTVAPGQSPGPGKKPTGSTTSTTTEKNTTTTVESTVPGTTVTTNTTPRGTTTTTVTSPPPTTTVPTTPESTTTTTLPCDETPGCKDGTTPSTIPY